MFCLLVYLPPACFAYCLADNIWIDQGDHLHCYIYYLSYEFAKFVFFIFARLYLSLKFENEY